jgi:hypothetical protein
MNTRRAMEWAELCLARARAETALLAAITGAPRQARAILEEHHVTAGDIANVDTAAIYLTLHAAGEPLGPPRDRSWIAFECRRLLLAVDCWRDDDERSFVAGGSVWGPGPLVTLLCRVPFDAALLVSKITALRAIDQRQRETLDGGEGRHRCA